MTFVKGHSVARYPNDSDPIKQDECSKRYTKATAVPIQVSSLKYANKKSSCSCGKTSYGASVSPKKSVATTDPSLSGKRRLSSSKMKKLEDAKGLWPELLPEVLWAYRTTPKTSTGKTLYLPVYRTDAVIPVDVGEPNLRYSNESRSSNNESRLHDLDEVEERRDMAHIRMVAQKQQVERYYNKKDKIRPLRVGDYVLKAKTQAAKDPNKGKLGINWDGPHKITAAASKGAFQLETMEGKLLQNNWNVAHLKYFHF
uniref:Uncharacterized protein LOC104246939 n=1 Tax=Nicotiana sylvestris TaxID=4096 RepID=A0A1U7YDF1_NICSY|nr:PREDICTED: uncharacterized protein LOC104246939 [Nicotiana sylvestris]